MPNVYKNDLKRKFAPATNLPKERVNQSKVYHYKESHTVDEVTGDGIFSNVGNLVSPAVKLISNNKDLIANAAKGAAAVGGIAATIGSIVKANKELEQLNQIQKLRAEAAATAAKTISENAKMKIANIPAPTTPITPPAPTKVVKGDGIVKF